MVWRRCRGNCSSTFLLANFLASTLAAAGWTSYERLRCLISLGAAAAAAQEATFWSCCAPLFVWNESSIHAWILLGEPWDTSTSGA